MVEAVDDYGGGNDSLLYAIQDYDRDRVREAENKARKAGEKATREAEERLKTSAENKEDDSEEEFTTASLLKEQKALQQRKVDWSGDVKPVSITILASGFSNFFVEIPVTTGILYHIYSRICL